MLILMYAFIVLVPFCLFVDCQADFDIDKIQRRELVNVYGVQRYIRVIIIISSVTLYSSHKGQFHQMD